MPVHSRCHRSYQRKPKLNFPNEVRAYDAVDIWPSMRVTESSKKGNEKVYSMAKTTHQSTVSTVLQQMLAVSLHPFTANLTVILPEMVWLGRCHRCLLESLEICRSRNNDSHQSLCYFIYSFTHPLVHSRKLRGVICLPLLGLSVR